MRSFLWLASVAVICADASWQNDVDREFFKRHGYLVLRNFADAEQLRVLRHELTLLVDAWNPSADRTGLAGSLSLRRNATDHSFLLNSSTQASIFVEAAALDEMSTAPRLTLPKRHAVRKVGHGIHFVSEVIARFVTSEAVAFVLQQLGWESPAVAQTVYRIHPPLALGVDRHQDSTSILTMPSSVVGLWLSLEDADEENGCIHVRPASHTEPLRERLHRSGVSQSESGGVVIKKLGNATAAPLESFVPQRTRAGDLIVLHGLTEHYSPAGRDPERSRESFQMHFVEAEARWADDNWMQYPEGVQFMRVATPSCPSDVARL
mmetsp:Transcript_49091/g.116856  ORF Transcript_49091/g.116856 Transcript_49091/m.116856 type:complete len:321 (-) Transcript_49091:8-970(-)